MPASLIHCQKHPLSRLHLTLPPLPLLPVPLPLPLQLDALRRKRVSDLLLNHCKKALGHITTHKVRAHKRGRKCRAVLGSVVCFTACYV